MPVGKDSIQKRVAKTAPAAKTVEAEAKAKEVKAEAVTETPAKPAAKKAATAKKPATPKAEAPKADRSPEATAPATAVMGNVAPETVEAVIGHSEKTPADKVQIGQKMPTHLL